MFDIPEALRNRVLRAKLTPAKLAQIFMAIAQKMNNDGLDDAAVDFDFALPDDVFGASDLLPSITFGLRKAIVPPPAAKLVLPGGNGQ
jgi:hypothetical protein